MTMCQYFSMVATAIVLTTAMPPALSQDKVELWQSSYRGPGKPGFFQMKIDGTSGWVELTKESAGNRRRDLKRLRPAEVQALFRRLNDMHIWEVQPLHLDKPDERHFVHTAKLTIREGRRKRTIAYQIDKEYTTDGATLVSRNLEPNTQLSQIDHFLCDLGRPLREPVNQTPD